MSIEAQFEKFGTAEVYRPNRLNGRGALEKRRRSASVAGIKPLSRFRLLTWSEISFEVGEEALIKGVLPTQGFTLVYGESGSGKTHFTTDLALHIAEGKQWFGHKVQAGGVLYIAAEGGLSMMRRIVGYRQHHGIGEDVPFALLPCPINLLDPEADLPELLVLIKQAADKIGRRLQHRLGRDGRNIPGDLEYQRYVFGRLRSPRRLLAGGCEPRRRHDRFHLCRLRPAPGGAQSGGGHVYPLRTADIAGLLGG